MGSINFNRFLKTYSGQELLKKHSLNEYGVWHIKGEDPNCDLGGYHHQPNLGYVEGRLCDIIHAAVEMKEFWTWGGGGSITKNDPPHVRKVKEVIEDTEEITKLLKEREAIDARIKELEKKK